MKLFLKSIALVAILFVITYHAHAQSGRKWEDIGRDSFYQADTVKKHGLTLIFINKDSLFSSVTIQRLKDVFWLVYPKMLKRFNHHSLKFITIVISQDYRGVAATLNGIVKIDQNWLTGNPEDIDVITHELMHVIQGYTYDVPAKWLTDGIADYARYSFGVNNEKSGWKLPPYKPGQSYNNTYRIAARFLVWVEKHKQKNIVDRLNEALYQRKYTDDIWIKLTGKSLDDLWAEYSGAPII